MTDKVDLKEKGLVRSVLFVGDERGSLLCKCEETPDE